MLVSQNWYIPLHTETLCKLPVLVQADYSVYTGLYIKLCFRNLNEFRTNAVGVPRDILTFESSAHITLCILKYVVLLGRDGTREFPYQRWPPGSLLLVICTMTTCIINVCIWYGSDVVQIKCRKAEWNEQSKCIKINQRKKIIAK